MAFRSTIDTFTTGEEASAAVLNRPLLQLLDNDNHLKGIIDAASIGGAIFVRAVTLNSAVAVGSPVYYDSGNSRYDLALADGSAKEYVVGICYSKTNSTLGDIVLLGAETVDISGVISGGLTAGPYYLSTSVAGQMVSSRPTPSVQVLISDGAGKVWVYPQIRDYQGPQGAQGAQGSQGTQGLSGATTVLSPPSYSTSSATYTAGSNGENVIFADSTSNLVAITLPAAASNTDREFKIIRIGASNNVTVEVTGGANIDGVTTKTLATQYSFITVKSNGTQWYSCG